MLLDFDGSPFEEVVETYGGFPLKSNFMVVGNAALERYGVKAEYKDGFISISYVCRPYFTDEELDDAREQGCTPKDIARMKESKLYAQVVIEVQDPSAGITKAGYDAWADGDGEYDDYEIIDDHLTEEEWDLQIKMTEAFLNVAVDAG